MTKFREAMPFPTEHMRLIGEICTQWTIVELVVLQAVCELSKISQSHARYLGGSIPFGTRVDMLTAYGVALRETKAEGTIKIAKEIHVLGNDLRSAYILRCKYAHAELSIREDDGPPMRSIYTVTKKIEIRDHILSISEMEADFDIIHDVYLKFIRFMQCRFSIVETSWL